MAPLPLSQTSSTSKLSPRSFSDVTVRPSELSLTSNVSSFLNAPCSADVLEMASVLLTSDWSVFLAVKSTSLEETKAQLLTLRNLTGNLLDVVSFGQENFLRCDLHNRLLLLLQEKAAVCALLEGEHLRARWRELRHVHFLVLLLTSIFGHLDFLITILLKRASN